MTNQDKNSLLPALDEKTLRQVAQGLGVGVAVVEPENWTVLFENAKFFTWFPPEHDADEPLNTRLPKFNAQRALSRTQAGRTYSFETETRAGRAQCR